MVGCRTGVILKETPLSITETRKAVVSVIGEPRKMSSNGRELSSKYYDRSNNMIERMEMQRERYWTHVTILGDRRPYDVQVEVFLEERDEEGVFRQSDRDDARAEEMADTLKKTLYQSLDNRNIIDDFRSF